MEPPIEAWCYMQLRMRRYEKGKVRGMCMSNWSKGALQSEYVYSNIHTSF